MKRIVVAVDFNEEVNDVLDVASSIATATGAGVDVVHIYSTSPEFVSAPPYFFPGMPVSEDLAEHGERVREQRKRVREIVGKLQKRNIEVVGHMRASEKEDVVRGIVEFAREREADMIVIGTHRPGRIERIVMGSTTEGVVRQSEIPVLIVPRKKGGGEPEPLLPPQRE